MGRKKYDLYKVTCSSYNSNDHRICYYYAEEFKYSPTEIHSKIRDLHSNTEDIFPIESIELLGVYILYIDTYEEAISSVKTIADITEGFPQKELI